MIRAAYHEAARPASSAISPTRRALVLHDGVTFLVLTLITGALFGVTLFLFKSFESHRADLAKTLAERGRAELQAGQPAPAAVSLRYALGYAPDDYASQLLLAQALADSGETDQAMNYFLNLQSARPGDGLLNLQLARLERLKGHASDAVKYYRASIFGDWRGDGAIKRRDVRLELADYLIGQHEDAAAEVELLIAAGNAAPSLHLNKLFGDKLLAAGDAADALAYYQKEIADNPRDGAALAAAGRILYGRGEYARAQPLLDRAATETPGDDSLTALARDADRMVHLSLSRDLPARERAQHILAAAKIAEARLTACAAQSAGSAASLTDLQTQWKAAGEGPTRNALAENAAGEDTLTQLIFDTERQAAEVCGAPTGDDALLLTLAGHPRSSEAP